MKSVLTKFTTYSPPTPLATSEECNWILPVPSTPEKKKKKQTQTKPLSTIPMPCSQPPSKPPPLPHSGGLAMN